MWYILWTASCHADGRFSLLLILQLQFGRNRCDIFIGRKRSRGSPLEDIHCSIIVNLLPAVDLTLWVFFKKKCVIQNCKIKLIYNRHYPPCVLCVFLCQNNNINCNNKFKLILSPPPFGGNPRSDTLTWWAVKAKWSAWRPALSRWSPASGSRGFLITLWLWIFAL